MEESELKMIIREELEKIINEEKIDEFGRGRTAAIGKALGFGGLTRGGIAGDNPARKAKELANKQSEQLKQVAAQLQKIVQFLNQMTK